MSEKSVINQKVEKTIVVDRKTVKGSMFILSRFYELEEHEFNVLLTKSNNWTDIAKNVLYIGLGIAFSLLSKYAWLFVQFFQAKSAQEMLSLQAKFEVSEFISLGIVIVVWVVCYMVSLRKKDSQRTQLIDTIKSKYKGQ